MVPTWTGKLAKKGRHFPVRENSGNFKQTGNVRENHKKIMEKSWNFRQILFIIFSDIEMKCVLFAKMDQVFSFKKTI